MSLPITNRVPLILILSVLLLSCEDSTTPTATTYNPVSAPSRNLPAYEIMRLEGITSIHFTEFYHATVNGHADTGFTPYFEYHIDTLRTRMNQYYLGTPDWNISVYDLRKGIAWNYYSGSVTYPQLQDLRRAYEQDVQAYLGGWLSEIQTYVRTEYIDDKLCDVFTDSTGTLEWVWREYRLPVQRRLETTYKNIHQITYRLKKEMQINIVFPDSLFTPPQ